MSYVLLPSDDVTFLVVYERGKAGDNERGKAGDRCHPVTKYGFFFPSDVFSESSNFLSQIVSFIGAVERLPLVRVFYR